jgi:hypothetical protein
VAAATIRRQSMLVVLLAGSVFLAGVGRLVSMSTGLPEPAAVWLGYLIPKLVLPWVAIAAQVVTKRRVGMG